MRRSRINLKLLHFYGTSYEITSRTLRDLNISFKMYMHILSHRLSGELDTTRHWEREFGSDTCIFQANYIRVCSCAKSSTYHSQQEKKSCLHALFLYFLGVPPHSYTSYPDHWPPTSMLGPTLRSSPTFLICFTLGQGHCLIYLPSSILDDLWGWLCPGADLSCRRSRFPHMEGDSHPQRNRCRNPEDSISIN